MIGDLKPDLRIGLPIQAKIIIAVGLAIVLFMTGYKTAVFVKNAEITKLEKAHLIEVNKAKDAALAEHVIARAAEQRAAKSIADAAAKYEEDRQNEKAISDRTIADLHNRVTRLRVSLDNASATRGVPGPAAGPGSCDGPSEATLSGSVAARLAGRYADYNALVGVLELCQATIRADRAK